MPETKSHALMQGLKPDRGLAATVLISARTVGGCGYRAARIFIDKVKQPASPQMELGIKVHDTIENYINGVEELPEEITKGLPDLDTIIEAEDFKLETIGGGLRISYKMDARGETIIFDWKTGKVYPESKIQGKLYNTLDKAESATLVYFDAWKNDDGTIGFKYRETIEGIKGTIPEKELLEWADRILNRTLPEKKVALCQYCHVKDECPLWQGKQNDLTDKLSEAASSLDELLGLRDKAYKEHLEARDLAVDLKKKEVAELKETAKSQLSALKYPTPRGTVSIIEKIINTVKYDPETEFPFDKFPKLWKPREAKKAEMNKKLTDARKEELSKPGLTREVRIDNGGPK